MTTLPAWSVVPFGALLACIALLPLRAPHFWESNRNKAVVSGALALVFAAWLAAFDSAYAAAALSHAALDYVSFMAMVGALFGQRVGLRVGPHP